jgi:hypothetical protein
MVEIPAAVVVFVVFVVLLVVLLVGFLSGVITRRPESDLAKLYYSAMRSAERAETCLRCGKLTTDGVCDRCLWGTK